MERFRAAEAEFAAMIAQALRVQARAEALARGAYDTLEPARIDYLGKVFEIELLKRDAAAIWTKGPTGPTGCVRAGARTWATFGAGTAKATWRLSRPNGRTRPTLYLTTKA
ncbi:MAG: hypothetical protein V4595_07000 [Pseudomonadota bacterium]